MRRKTFDIEQGNGYHDHPWGTEQLFWTHRHWRWGRTSSVMFADVKPAAPFVGSLCFCYCVKQDRIDLTSKLDLSGADVRRDHLWGLRFPHELTVGIPEPEWVANCCGSLLDTPIYNRSKVSWTPCREDNPTPESRVPAPTATGQDTGWLEYYDLKPWLRPFVYLGFKVMAFFWRPFPYFGK